jgi:hypothetical protein
MRRGGAPRLLFGARGGQKQRGKPAAEARVSMGRNKGRKWRGEWGARVISGGIGRVISGGRTRRSSWRDDGRWWHRTEAAAKTTTKGGGLGPSWTAPEKKERQRDWASNSSKQERGFCFSFPVQKLILIWVSAKFDLGPIWALSMLQEAGRFPYFCSQDVLLVRHRLTFDRSSLLPMGGMGLLARHE